MKLRVSRSWTRLCIEETPELSLALKPGESTCTWCVTAPAVPRFQHTLTKEGQPCPQGTDGKLQKESLMSPFLMWECIVNTLPHKMKTSPEEERKFCSLEKKSQMTWVTIVNFPHGHRKNSSWLDWNCPYVLVRVNVKSLLG